jgi:hypothetical protein
MSLDTRMLESYQTIVWPVEFKGLGFDGEEPQNRAVKRESPAWVTVIRDGVTYYAEYNNVLSSIGNDWPIVVDAAHNECSRNNRMRRNKILQMTTVADGLVQELDYIARYGDTLDSERVIGARAIGIENKLKILQEMLAEYKSALPSVE